MPFLCIQVKIDYVPLFVHIGEESAKLIPTHTGNQPHYVESRTIPEDQFLLTSTWPLILACMFLYMYITEGQGYKILVSTTKPICCRF